MEALITDNCDDYLLPLPELLPTFRVRRLPSLRLLKAQMAAREATCQPTRDCSSKLLTKKDTHTISWRCPCRGNEEVRLSDQGERIKEQRLIPNSVAIAGAASLGLRRRNRRTSEPPSRIQRKSALMCPERAQVDNLGKSNSQVPRMSSCVPGTRLAPKPPALPRTGPEGRRLFNKHVLHIVATEVSPSHTKDLPQ